MRLVRDCMLLPFTIDVKLDFEAIDPRESRGKGVARARVFGASRCE